jgi:hypothetical protein
MTKTTIALVAALIAGTASVASAQGEFDPNLGNRYPAYDEPVAATPGLQSSQARLHNKTQGLQSSQVRLQNNTRGQAGEGFTTQAIPTQSFPYEGRPQVHTFRYDSSPVISSF